MKFKSLVICASISLLIFFVDDATAETTLLQFSQLIDGNGVELDANEVVVSAGEIVAVGKNLSGNYPVAQIIDLKGLIGLPGLIDVHTHITYALPEQPKGDAWSELWSTPVSEVLVASIGLAMKTLQTGVTTLRDLNAENDLSFHLRALIEEGIIEGPRIYTAGEGICREWRFPDVQDGQRPEPEQVAKFAAQQIAAGADWIKFFATTGSDSDLTSTQLFFYEDMKAVVELANHQGKRVAVHSLGPEAVPDAIRAGVHSIEHAVGMSDELLSTWAASSTFYVPTIDHNRYYAEHRSEFGYGDEVVQGFGDFIVRNVDSLRRAHKAGVRIAMGSDAVLTGGGEKAHELVWFGKAGMSNAETLNAAISNGAELLGMEKKLGRLAPGFYADIIAVEANPLEDISAVIDGVVWVMKDGRVVAGSYERD